MKAIGNGVNCMFLLLYTPLTQKSHVAIGNVLPLVLHVPRSHALHVADTNGTVHYGYYLPCVQCTNHIELLQRSLLGLLHLAVLTWFSPVLVGIKHFCVSRVQEDVPKLNALCILDANEVTSKTT